MDNSLVEILLSKQPKSSDVIPLFEQLEQKYPCDILASPEKLYVVWELRWSSSKLPYLQVKPWLENLQILLPADNRAMNFIRFPQAFAKLGGIAVIAELQLVSSSRVGVRFIKGGWIGPRLPGLTVNLLGGINQSFPAWLDITHLTDKLRLCRGSNGTLFALVKRDELIANDLIPSI